MTPRAWLLFAVMSVLWGIPYLFIKVAIEEVPPVTVVFVRVALAALVLLPVAVRRRALRPVRGHWRAVLALALLQITGPFLLITYGEQHITSSLTGLLIAAEPLFVALLALRLDRSEQVTGTQLLRMLVGMAGVAALLGLDHGGKPGALLGGVMVLLATLCYALAALLAKRTLTEAAPLGVVTAATSASALVLLPLAAFQLPAEPPSTAAIASMVTLGLLCTALAFLAFYALISEAGASRATVFTYVNPAVAVVLGVTLLGEPFTGATVAGFLLIITGSWLATLGRADRTKGPTRSGGARVR